MRVATSRRSLSLSGVVKSYAWGEKGPGAFIPRWAGLDPAGQPAWAELWFGAHPSGPSPIDEGSDLAALVAADPSVLGADAARRFGGLPFLVKLIAVAQPLSLQAHPNADQAREGFAREESAGIPLDDPRRLYKDPRAKPELLIALTEFWALQGFRDPGPAPHPELAFLQGSLKDRLSTALSLPAGEADRVLGALCGRLRREGPFPTDRPEHWLLKAEEIFCPGPRKDPGLFAFFLLNLARLAPGEAIFLRPGELHAYLHGTGVEVMGNSDNVLRGGLTSKPVHREGLLDILLPEPTRPAPIHPDDKGVYRAPADAFEAAAVSWEAGTSVPSEGLALWLPLEGRAEWRGPEGARPLAPGRALFLPAGASGRLAGVTKGRAVFVRVPGDRG